ncbi:MAG: hypothetical protein KBD96_03890, partial [Brachymonas sp.]|nr:hypothetical protein [Brachymonas sp.]MBP6966604.1 hypothetical protein [Brachymonas sp.]MBP8597038.1 hypothetical protein [Brachymonas sp.]MBP9590148.1 hypothetical protein [Brachymonas sp.]
IFCAVSECMIGGFCCGWAIFTMKNKTLAQHFIYIACNKKPPFATCCKRTAATCKHTGAYTTKGARFRIGGLLALVRHFD